MSVFCVPCRAEFSPVAVAAAAAQQAQTEQRFLARLPKPGTTSLTDVSLEEEGHLGQREKGPKEQRACFGAAN